MAEKSPLEETNTPGSGASASARTGLFSRPLPEMLIRGGPIIALILVYVFFMLTSPYFMKEGNQINVLRRMSITAILALGQTFVILTGGIDLSVGAVAALAASIGAVLMTRQIEIAGMLIGPVDFGVGFLIALVIGILAGLFNGIVITKGRIPDFIVTLGSMELMRGIALLVTEGLPVPSHLTATELKGYLPDQMKWLGTGDLIVPVPGLIALIILVIAWLILRNTALGRAIYAVGGNREAARVSGINVDRTKIAVYVISGVLAAIAGIVLAGRLNSANALMASEENLNSIAAVVIGGTNLFGGEGGVFGSFVGAWITGVLGNGLNLLNVSDFWQRVVQGLVIILVVLFDQWRRRRFVKA